LLFLNFAVDPAILAARVPDGTELDTFNGSTYVSIVGFSFLNTRIVGIPVPFHRNFPEVNLRFYVRYRGPEGWRRGVVFIKEIVPRRAIAAMARWTYNENYVALPMGRYVAVKGGTIDVKYSWRLNGVWHAMSGRAEGSPAPLRPGSHEEFIAEHYYGYVVRRDGATGEYRVEHPTWEVWPVHEWNFECDVAALYGPEFAECLNGSPASVFMADGSDIAVRWRYALTEDVKTAPTRQSLLSESEG
jgi:uncharacterized protein YqjF (DUF2071 family)